MCDATYVQDGKTFLFAVFFSYMQTYGKKISNEHLIELGYYVAFAFFRPLMTEVKP
jgi:hypothetical protein